VTLCIPDIPGVGIIGLEVGLLVFTVCREKPSDCVHACRSRGMYAPGIIGLVVGIFVLTVCREKPSDFGFPPVESDEPPKKKGEATMSIWDSLLQNVLKNPFIWGMAFTYFFVYIIRQVRPSMVLIDWTPCAFTAMTHCWHPVQALH
jgi:sugar phosphate permease